MQITQLRLEYLRKLLTPLCLISLSYTEIRQVYILWEWNAQKPFLKQENRSQTLLVRRSTRSIYFTAGGSESDNWAIRGCAQLGEKKGKKHIITTAFEHHAVLHTCQYLEKLGFEVTYLPVGDKGLVTTQQVEDAIRDDTCLVTIMTANNEIDRRSLPQAWRMVPY